MPDYAALKWTHVTCAALSYCLFFVRGIWMMTDSALLRARWVRIVPHAVDTLLLASAVAMAVMIRQYPFVAPWLTGKVIALILYIGLGMAALRPGRTRAVRIGAWMAAQATFAYIVAVAIMRNPLPWTAIF